MLQGLGIEPGLENMTAKSAENRVSYEDRLVRALERLDTRVVPRPEPFDMSSGQSIREFFSEFEAYCEHSFRTRKNTWIGELGRRLAGELKGAFEALRGLNDKYRDIKGKLMQWYTDSREQCQLETKAAFGKAVREPYEPLRLYSARLERLFKMAHPKRNIENSKVLLIKFLETVSTKFRRQIENAIGIAKIMTGKTLMWTRIVTLASLVDTQKKHHQSSR